MLTAELLAALLVAASIMPHAKRVIGVWGKSSLSQSALNHIFSVSCGPMFRIDAVGEFLVAISSLLELVGRNARRK
jgi:hypothetical protein